MTLIANGQLGAGEAGLREAVVADRAKMTRLLRGYVLTTGWMVNVAGMVEKTDFPDVDRKVQPAAAWRRSLDVLIPGVRVCTGLVLHGWYYRGCTGLSSVTQSRNPNVPAGKPPAFTHPPWFPG